MFFCHRKRLLACMLVLTVAFAGLLQAQEETTQVGRLGDVHDGNRSAAVHHINLFTEDGFKIFPGLNSDQPFSTFITCGQCHHYEVIGQGWHFNTDPESAPAGRPGEPWIYWDCATGTQIPLSKRPWKGTFDPASVGLSDWWFTRVFGRQMAGGGPGVFNEEVGADPDDRWGASGDLQINCLSCHNGDPLHDQSQYALQIAKHNFRWAATATATFAHVEGGARRLPDSFLPGDTSEFIPTVKYDDSRFFADNKVFMQLQRDVPDKRCNFCHSTKVISDDPVNNAVDVHMAAGMSCVDCHHNGLNHMISRGYETEAADTNDVHVAQVSCKGCHMGTEDAEFPDTGAFTAPYPKHVGMPAIHFEKLSCTSCHSGPWPQDRSFGAKTSRAHGLATRGVNTSDETLPHITMPVFAPGHDGKIAPHKLMWPAYWASVDDANTANVTPLVVDTVKETAGKLLPFTVELANSSWPDMNEATVKSVLEALSAVVDAGHHPAYISGGKLYTAKDGSLVAKAHEVAQPYMWPIAHGVRPAEQSLGVRFCEDCHGEGSGYLLGKVAVDGPLADPNDTVAMMELQQLDDDFQRLFASTFRFRPMMKIVILVASALIGLVILLFILKALDGIIKFASKK
jgi:hypothetical protein